MLVMSVNSKRQRRPSVRLLEIGDMSAAWACGFSQNTKAENDEHNHPIYYDCYGLSDFTFSEFSVPPQIFAELDQNRESNDRPNSPELALQSAGSAELATSMLNFTNVTRKCRDMKRRGRCGGNDGYVVPGCSWSSKHSPADISADEAEFGETDKAGCTSNLQENENRQTPTRSKETSESDIDRPQLLQGDKSKHNAGFHSGKQHPECGYKCDGARVENGDVSAVGRWLEEAGFSKYACVFEMHEVDGEALPLLTVEDLKEMGICSVGPRRKLYNAIQQLKGEEE